MPLLFRLVLISRSLLLFFGREARPGSRSGRIGGSSPVFAEASSGALSSLLLRMPRVLLRGSLVASLAITTLFASDQPNIVLIMADDVGYECFSSYGSREYSTPRLDALAEEGIRFENCHSTPLCTPSRVNLMSGKSNVFNYYNFGVYPKGQPTFANHLKDQGYSTAVAGKWQLILEDKGITPIEAGFDTYCLWNMPQTSRNRYWNPSLDQNGKILDLPENAYGPDVCASFLELFIKEQAKSNTPFLAYYPMILPHNPFPPAPNTLDQNSEDDKANFIDMVNYLDSLVGRLVDALEESGVRDNTLIIFTSDNGTNADLTSDFQGKDIVGGKGYTKDHGTHVPLIISWPGVIPPKQVNSDLIAFSDFLPTIAEAVNLPPKTVTESDGISFWPQCVGQQGTKREWIYGYYFPRPYAESFDNKYRHWEVRYARDERFKLYDNGDFFDTQSDVLEKSPLDPERLSPAAKRARKALQAVIDSYPSQGQAVDYSLVNGVRD